MKRYRIIERKNNYTKTKSYQIQKKSFLGFWYNPDNCDGYATGVYADFEEAKKDINMKLSKVMTKIVYES